VKKFILVLVISLFISGCETTEPVDTSHCIEIANTADNNGQKSADELYQECLDEHYKKQRANMSFWESAVEGLLIFVVEVTTS